MRTEWAIYVFTKDNVLLSSGAPCEGSDRVRRFEMPIMATGVAHHYVLTRPGTVFTGRVRRPGKKTNIGDISMASRECIVTHVMNLEIKLDG